MAKLYIGTSGWDYKHWDNVFYPTHKNKLEYFSQQFKTVEINYSFYHLPSPATYQNWYEQTPKDFLFALKASRFITHIKRIKNVDKEWQGFMENALSLKEKLGPILFQFPATFKADPDRLKNFLETIANQRTKFAFEFRHQSWANKEIYHLLEKHNAACVIADSPSYPKMEIITADFIYIRQHGSFALKYTRKELLDLKQKVNKWLQTGKDIYVYFNNDAKGYAVENAKELIELCNDCR